ncbi:MAG: molybdenum cofactor biosynthesis protein MoaE [Hyphomicrobiales bacterium]|nr:molybdenum cofactor biosynthesis protein MoaE [Hyphomicrobiales bacterium]MCY4033576.1 molybdenum cofactor biosynthesis protein MoaE [Hyphomicrobiales bacterium]MCY4039324.1 molybdenum cofactor biosynthesis protein MoaE [Hyphomicrobiales bacterium]
MIRVQREPFDVGEAYGRLISGLEGKVGGVAMFVGLVRDFSQAGEDVRRMTLEHYPGMAEKELERLVEEASRKWELLGHVLIHRYGALELGEPIVLVMTAAARREAALSACSFLIEWLKTRAPFWKLEEDSKGRERWVEGE